MEKKGLVSVQKPDSEDDLYYSHLMGKYKKPKNPSATGIGTSNPAAEY